MKSLEARKREALYWISGLVWTLAVLLFIVLSEVESLEDAPALMEANTLYYALSTIAQCAAALAALIGFLGLWRQDRLKQERDQAERDLRGLLIGRHLGVSAENCYVLHIDDIIQRAEQFIAEHRDAQDQNPRQVALKMDATLRRWRARPSEQQRLMRALKYFLGGTLAILVLTIVGLVFVDELRTCWATPWLLIGASVGLGIGPAYVVRQAARYEEFEPGW